jgi:acetylornithine/N-succinyldiaminopimelate aminotransferase
MASSQSSAVMSPLSSPLMTTYLPQPVSFSHGQGVWLYGTDGRRYLDCLSGIAVNTLGHAHPRLVKALSEQISRIIHTSNLFEVPEQRQVAQRLVDLSGMENVFFCNSGLEANEAAIKVARLYGHNKGIAAPEIIVYEKAFHGRSLATLSATGNDKVQKGFEPLVTGFVRVPLNDTAAINKVAAEHPNVCAVFLEAIQGEGGIQPARAEYLHDLRKICDAKGWLLMVDEVQCGTGRTGKWFAHQWSGIKPDVVPIAKGIGSGVPMGAIICNGIAARTFKPGNHGTTFGGNPLAMRAALTTMQVMEDDGLLENAHEMGLYIRAGLSRELAGVAGINDVRGQGLMMGIELNRPCPEAVKMALDVGLVLNVTAGNVIRLLPPLIFAKSHADELVTKLAPIIKHILSQQEATA